MNKLIVKDVFIYILNKIRLLLIYTLLFQSLSFCNPTNLDTSFNQNEPIPGILSIPPIDFNDDYAAQASFASIIQPDDQKIIVSGWGSINTTYYSIFLARYLPNGDLDTIINGGSGFGIGDPAPGYINAQLYSNANNNGLMSVKAYAMALQSDGKIIVAAKNNYNLALIRFTSSGLIDTTFNSHGANPGYIITSISTNTSDINSISIDLQSTGKIIVSSLITLIDETQQVAIYRYTANGILDTTFPSGSGPGYLTSYINPSSTSTTPYNIAILPNDKIIVGCKQIINDTAQVLIARYTSNGILDTTFNNTGYVSFTNSSNIISDKGALVVQSNGDVILVVTTINPSLINEIITMQYTSNGIIDSSFGTGEGFITTSIANSFDLTAQKITLESSGKFLITGFVNLNTLSEPIYSVIIARYNTDGSLDTDFHPLGYVTTAIGTSPGDSTFAYSTIVQEDEKLLITGQYDNHLFIARYIGGTTIQNIQSNISSYGNNFTFIPNFFYTTYYATIITDQTVRSELISTVESTLSEYNVDYTNQLNFNYVTHLYLLKAELARNHETLKSNYPKSSTEIDLYFSYINKQILNLITAA